jgi:hypothetical protein
MLRLSVFTQNFIGQRVYEFLVLFGVYGFGDTKGFGTVFVNLAKLTHDRKCVRRGAYFPRNRVGLFVIVI